MNAVVFLFPKKMIATTIPPTTTTTTKIFLISSQVLASDGPQLSPEHVADVADDGMDAAEPLHPVDLHQTEGVRQKQWETGREMRDLTYPSKVCRRCLALYTSGYCMCKYILTYIYCSVWPDMVQWTLATNESPPPSPFRVPLPRGCSRDHPRLFHYSFPRPIFRPLRSVSS